MIRYLLGAAALLSSTAAVATDIQIVGANPPPTINVTSADRLVTAKRLMEYETTDGVVWKRYAYFYDRVNMLPWILRGATQLHYDGFIAGKGYVYSPIGASAPTPPAPPAPAPVRKPALLGVNLSGLEAGGNGKLYWTHTPPTKADIAMSLSKGVKLFRIPYKVARAADPAEVAAMKTAIDQILADPTTEVLLDDHEYGSAYISTVFNAKTVADTWTSLLTGLGHTNDARVILGLQNEPNKAGAAWWAGAQGVTSELRARGVTNYLSVAGAGWSGASGWVGSNSAQIAAFKDPLNRTYYEMHVYFDSDASGTHVACKAGTDARLDAALAHATANNYNVIVGEIAFSNDPSCDAVRAAAIGKLKASPAVHGVAFWSMGDFYPYPSYIYGLTGTLDPVSGKQVGKGKTSVVFDKILTEWNK